MIIGSKTAQFDLALNRTDVLLDKNLYFEIKMKQQGILSADALIRWKKSIGSLKVPVLPKHIIICPQHVMPSRYRSFGSKEIKGIMGRHICINQDKGIYLSTGWGIGGPALVAICEELHALGAQNFVLIGLVGRLTESVPEAEIMYAESVFRDEGTSHHYLPDTKTKIIDCPSDSYFKKFKDMGFHQGRFVSTDAPFRETLDKHTDWTDSGCTMIDMETAALYAFAKYHKVNAVSIGIGGDSIANNEWGMPDDFKLLKAIVRKTVFKMIDLLV